MDDRGRVFAWGNNDDHRLGTEGPSTHVPTELPTFSDRTVHFMLAGYDQSLVIAGFVCLSVCVDFDGLNVKVRLPSHRNRDGKVEAFVWGGKDDAGHPMEHPTVVEWFDPILRLMMEPTTTSSHGGGTARPTKDQTNE